MSPRLSVIICTRNPRPDYLQRVFGALQRQTFPTTEWELILVDNNSREPLESTVVVSWHSNARVVRENNIGLTHARLRGFSEAASPVLIYVDDDNVLALDYLATAIRLADDMPFIGVWSASIQGEFETPPEPWMKSYLPYLALTEFETDRWANHPQGKTLPVGAGMVVRRRVLEAYHASLRTNPHRLGMDRTTDSLLAGGDTDIGLAACSIGLGCAYMTTLHVTHLISAKRLTPYYLSKLVEDVTASHRLLDLIHGIKLCGTRNILRLRLRLLIASPFGHLSSIGFRIALARGYLKGTVLFQRISRPSEKWEPR